METVLDAVEIQRILPHRYPFLLVDRIIALEEGKSATGIKNVTINEPFFQGHFPGYPVMPGVLMLEAMAQVGAVSLLKLEENKGKIGLFAGADKVKFRRQVMPGDQLRIEVSIGRSRGSFGRGTGVVYVGDDVACEAEIKFVLVVEEGEGT